MMMRTVLLVRDDRRVLLHQVPAKSGRHFKAELPCVKVRDYLANKASGINKSHTNVGYPSVSSVMWAGLVDKWSYEAIFDTPLWNCMMHVRLNQSVDDHTK